MINTCAQISIGSQHLSPIKELIFCSPQSFYLQESAQDRYQKFLWLLSGCACAKSLSHVWLFSTLWMIAWQVPLSLNFSSQEYWHGMPILSPGDLPNPGIKTTYLASLALAGGFFTTNATREALTHLLFHDWPFFNLKKIFFS